MNRFVRAEQVPAVAGEFGEANIEQRIKIFEVKTHETMIFRIMVLNFLKLLKSKFVDPCLAGRQACSKIFLFKHNWQLELFSCF